MALALGACGSGGHSTSSSAHSSQGHAGAAAKAAKPAPGPPAAAIPAPAPTGIEASPSAVRVIKGWSDALRRGDVQGAARYFALPSEMINVNGAGGQFSVMRIETPAEAVNANETLPCGAKFISADMRGRFVNVLFLLTGRPGPGGSSCGGGQGTTARTNFVITAGRIVEWIRAPDQPGDNQGHAAPPSGQGPVV